MDSRDALESQWRRIAVFAGLEGAFFGVAISDADNDLMKTDLITYGISEAWNEIYRDRGLSGSDPLIVAALALERPIPGN